MGAREPQDPVADRDVQAGLVGQRNEAALFDVVLSSSSSAGNGFLALVIS